MNTIIISAFPACGKTHFFNNYQNNFNGIMDSDSSDFSWVKDDNGNNTTDRNPDFPNNYIKHIKDNIGKVQIIFVSSHREVRDALRENGIDYYLIYPSINQKEEWIRRFNKRGSGQNFINFIDNSWDEFIESMDMETFPTKIKLPYRWMEYIEYELLIEIIHNAKRSTGKELVSIREIKHKALQGMPCSVCYGFNNVMDLYIGSTVHSICANCRSKLADALKLVDSIKMV